MKTSKCAWAVVYVWRGLLDKVELFSQEVSARKREDQLRKKMPQEDEVGVFCVARPS